jgi:hypothetical protein
MKKVIFTLAIAVIAYVVLAGAVRISHASVDAAKTRTCSYKRDKVLAAIVGVHKSAAPFHVFCVAFNSEWHGTRFTGHFGQVRCEFFNTHYNIGIGYLTRDAVYGRLFCRIVTPKMRKQHYIRIK